MHLGNERARRYLPLSKGEQEKEGWASLGNHRGFHGVVQDTPEGGGARLRDASNGVLGHCLSAGFLALEESQG